MYITVNGVDLYYEVSGSGPALILIHGNGESHEIFDKLSENLCEHFTVYAVDTRGQGKSGKVSQYHYADMAEDYARFIEDLGLDNPAVYGFSDGGIIALLLASKYPDLPGALIISGANTSPRMIKPLYLLLFKAVYFLHAHPCSGLCLQNRI